MRIDAKTSIYGVIGYPLGHTLSPTMHNAGFEAAKINAVYLAFPMKNIINIKYSMKQFGIKGLSVTIPYKLRIKRSLDEISPLAIQVGSVNTILRTSSGLLSGHTTDGDGAMDAIEDQGLQIKDKKVLIIGSGGSARSIIFSLLGKNPRKIALVSRNIHTTRSIIRGVRSLRKHPELEVFWHKVEKKSPRLLHSHEHHLTSPEQMEEYDVIIQTTPLGMKGHSQEQLSPLEASFLHKGQVVFDIVYNPRETPFVKLAKKKKIDIIPGYKMLLYQGARQFSMFTGETAPVQAMEKALIAELGKL